MRVHETGRFSCKFESWLISQLLHSSWKNRLERRKSWFIYNFIWLPAFCYLENWGLDDWSTLHKCTVNLFAQVCSKSLFAPYQVYSHRYTNLLYKCVPRVCTGMPWVWSHKGERNVCTSAQQSFTEGLSRSVAAEAPGTSENQRVQLSAHFALGLTMKSSQTWFRVDLRMWLENKNLSSQDRTRYNRRKWSGVVVIQH